MIPEKNSKPFRGSRVDLCHLSGIVFEEYARMKRLISSWKRQMESLRGLWVGGLDGGRVLKNAFAFEKLLDCLLEIRRDKGVLIGTC